MSLGTANDTASVEDRLDRALTDGTQYQKTIAFRDWLEASLLKREGEVLTPAIARERAANIAVGLMEFLYGRLT